MKYLLCATMISLFAIQGYNLRSLKEEVVPEKNVVIAFMSSECPCSLSYTDEFFELAKKYPQLTFVSILASKEINRFKAMSFSAQHQGPGLLLHDEQLTLANYYKANRTPHLFFFGPNKELLYQGGMGDRSNAKEATRHYLAEALALWSQGKPIKERDTKTLGCSIVR